MGVFSVIIEELEAIHSGAEKDAIALNVLMEMLDEKRGRIIGGTWQGNGATAFDEQCIKVSINLETLHDHMEIFADRVQKTLTFLRELDEQLFNPVEIVQAIFGF